MSLKLQNILLKLANDVLDLEKSGKTLGEPIDEAEKAILDLLDKSLVAPSGQAAPRDDGKGGYYDGYHQGIADVRKVIKEEL